MTTFYPSSHQGQYLVSGTSRIFLEDLSENAKLQMVNIQAADDQIANLHLRLNMLHKMRDTLNKELRQILQAEGLLD